MTRQRSTLVLSLLIASTGCYAEGPVSPLVRTAPSASVAAAVTDGPYFTPFNKAPQVTNRNEVAQALEDEYPTLLRKAGVEGKVDVWIQISPKGEIMDARVNRTSGHEALDYAALRVARRIAFTAAELDQKPVMVWVSIPITFKATPTQN